MKHIQRLSLILLLIVGLNSCDDPSSGDTGEPQELITHVIVELVDSANTNDTVRAMFIDIDGPSGSRQPEITGATITGGKTYLGSIKLYELRQDMNDSLVDLREEIRELATQHQFFYTVGGQAPNTMSTQITDKDANNLPLGLEFVLHTQPVHSVNNILNVVLSHFEEVGAKNGVDRSDESDIDIDFPITIQ